MIYVLDASVALKTVLSEPDSPAALKLRDEYPRYWLIDASGESFTVIVRR